MRKLIMAAALLTTICSLGLTQPKREMTVCIRKARFTSEIMDTAEGRALGLMHRDKLASGHGMLFVFETDGKYVFWMKNMKFPIDILWITPDMRVGEIHANVPPCDGKGECVGIEPVVDARYVLEIPAGAAKRYKISVGDRVTLQ